MLKFNHFDFCKRNFLVLVFANILEALAEKESKKGIFNNKQTEREKIRYSFFLMDTIPVEFKLMSALGKFFFDIGEMHLQSILMQGIHKMNFQKNRKVVEYLKSALT
ncbi:CLUMA_CG003305, isoform A [Clunio marinus]|uniref:CLUMA_CG003305, isoform A n=1 Tax=Clunio marinus TaxID=568069 RepID=A0A1J1HQH6_9DIPT|nr:CLUMA_CG003305, isoform A [Clunio marinus]